MVSKKTFLIMHYNVENLFDTIDDPRKNDNEFLPTSKKNWNTTKYFQKELNIAFVIQQIGKPNFPDIVSLVEIEDSTVLKDLISQESIAKANYKIIQHESPDKRGIDCALLYTPNTFTILSKHFYKVIDNSNKNFKTREILYVKGISKKANDTLNIFVNHWPSRLGGEEKSDPKRNLAALVLKNVVDSITNSQPNAKIIIVGDFNDEPNDNSILKTLNANNKIDNDINSLYNMSTNEYLNSEGTYYYSREKKWKMLDQMIISKSLLNSTKKLRPLTTNTIIFKPEWILKTDNNGNEIPFKTYEKEYIGGYSDHLPIYQYFYYK